METICRKIYGTWTPSLDRQELMDLSSWSSILSPPYFTFISFSLFLLYVLSFSLFLPSVFSFSLLFPSLLSLFLSSFLPFYLSLSSFLPFHLSFSLSLPPSSFLFSFSIIFPSLLSLFFLIRPSLVFLYWSFSLLLSSLLYLPLLLYSFPFTSFSHIFFFIYSEISFCCIHVYCNLTQISDLWRS